MKPLNYLERRKQLISFSVYFLLLLLFLFGCGAVTLVTAQKGVGLLEKKKDKYENIFTKQAEISNELEKVYKNLHSLKNKRRNLGEHKELQKLITNGRKSIEDKINTVKSDTVKSDSVHYQLYIQILSQVRDFQSIMDVRKKESDKHRHNMEQLEKCKQKYQEVSKLKIK